jgi:NADPH:quinone reductase-like Zn-dependent oxidoreductase
MYAAVVRSFDAPPAYEPFDLPASAEHQIVVDVLAAGLHPRVRSQADGSHYTSDSELPLVPGIDGVGRLPDGRLVFFVLPDTTMGSMAEQTVIDSRRSLELPDGADAVTLAAAMNPAMSSWVALRQRIDFQAGQSVLVLGAAGNAGRLAVQVAKRLGAGEVIAAGRDAGRLSALTALGADALVELGGDLPQAACDVDVVLDYLWGEPAANGLIALARGRSDAAKPVSWIQIGAVAGPDAAIPSAALRSTNLRVLGSGQGSVPTRVILDELRSLATEITDGSLPVGARTVPLSQVTQAWLQPSAERVVIVPDAQA